MRVHYDNIVFSLQKAGGISTYWSELINRLLRDNIDVVFEEFKHENIVRNTLTIKETSVNQSLKRFLILERFKPIRLVNKEPFIFHSSYNRRTDNPNAAQVTTVHDFVHEKFYRGLRRRLHLLQKNRILRSADAIIAVSENTKRDLLAYHPSIPEERIKVIYNGVSSDFYPLADEQKEQIQEFTVRPFLLYIGSREHYKNFNFTIDLLKEIKGFDLYIIGGALSKKEIYLLQHKIPGRWKHFNHISNNKLNELYNLAYALIYPSAYEGFGIPLLEAMKAGTPFLALNNSSIPEVAGKAGLLLERAEIHLFKNALEEIGTARQNFIDKGFVQAGNFSWEKCYQQTLSVYKELTI